MIIQFNKNCDVFTLDILGLIPPKSSGFYLFQILQKFPRELTFSTDWWIKVFCNSVN